ncbi:hypothetical protein KLO70_18345 [Clostridioides difficile]|nr:hypothetical protein [Clostridioides difficile]
MNRPTISSSEYRNIREIKNAYTAILNEKDSNENPKNTILNKIMNITM